MTSGIIRVKKEVKYFVASNEPFNDKNLSWEARGVMGYLLSKPDNWTVRTHDLVRQGPAKQHKVTRILNELKEAGYIRRERHRLEDGRFEWETVVYENAQKTITGKSSNGSSTTGQPTTGKTPHITSPESPITDSPRTDNGSTEREREAPAPSPAAPTPGKQSALKIYMSVTGIKKADRIPEVVRDWLSEQEKYMGAQYHPEALRAAVKELDKEGEKHIFNAEMLEMEFSNRVPYVTNANFRPENDGGFTINYIEMSNGDKLEPDKAAGWIVNQAKTKIENYLKQKQQAAE